MAYSLSDDQVGQISAAIYGGRKIEAIILYRQATGKGLKEAKDFIEALEIRLRAEAPERFTAPPGAGCSKTGAIVLIAGAAIYFFVSRMLA